MFGQWHAIILLLQFMVFPAEVKLKRSGGHFNNILILSYLLNDYFETMTTFLSDDE